VKPRSVVALALVGALSLVVLASSVLRAAASEPSPILPNLVADPPDNAVLVTDSTEGKSQLLLRFDGYLHNVGPGALEFRGSRQAPKARGLSERALLEDVQTHKLKEESLPQGLEEELALPAMKVTQRLYTTNDGNPGASEKYLERPHVEEASNAELFYSDADGHHHWHLQHIARYSLWNSSKTAEVAPAQKVGFCLDDSQHVEPGVGPETAVYSDSAPPYQKFCRRFEPNTTNVYEGISPGWRDVYSRELAFQWVDVSNVVPGEYWLREDIDPTDVVKQTGGGPKFDYAKTPSVVPGFDAEPAMLNVNEGEAKVVSLLSRSYEDEAAPVYTVVSAPQHGTLSAVEGSSVTYTPDPGYSGSDTFTFSAADPSSPFPEHPALATVSISVASTARTLSIGGAQDEMIAGTSVQLSATVANDNGGVEWSASQGVVTPVGADGIQATYTAPLVAPADPMVTVTARLRDDPAVSDEQTIDIEPVPPDESAPEVPEPEAPAAEPPATKPPSGSEPTSSQNQSGAGANAGAQGTAGFKAGALPASVARPRAMIVGRVLVMTTIPSVAGRVRLTAYLRGRMLGTCATQTPPERTFTCRVSLSRSISLRTPLTVRASLRTAGGVVYAVRRAQRVPEMKMRPVGAEGRVASAGGAFWCSPSTLVAVLAGGGSDEGRR
jgi:hypothetical protein